MTDQTPPTDPAKAWNAALRRRIEDVRSDRIVGREPSNEEIRRLARRGVTVQQPDQPEETSK